MNYIRFTIILMLLLITMFVSNTVADDPAYWYLPVGVKARIGKGDISDIKYSPDGKKLAVGSSIGIWLYDANTGDVLALFAGHTEDVVSIAFSPDGKTLVSASYDYTVRLWDVQTGKHKGTIFERTTHITFSPDGETLVTAGYTVGLWDVQTLKLKGRLTGHRSSRVTVAYSSDGKTIASESGRNVQLWDAYTGERKNSFTVHDHWVSPMVFSPDSKMLASGGSKDKLVCLWDTQTGENRKTFTGHTEGVSSVAYSPDGKTIASASYDNTIRLWNLETGEHERILTGHSESVYGITFSPDGNTLMSWSSDGTFRAWDPKIGELKRTFLHSPNLTHPAISPDGKLLAVGYDKEIQLWETDTGKLKTTLIGHTHPATSVKFSVDGAFLRSRDSEHILVWNVEREKIKQTLPNPPNSISDIKINGRTKVLSPDRALLAVGNSDGTIELCDTSTGEQRALFNKHTDRISVIAFSPDGTTLASVADDDAIQLWDLVNMKHIGTLEDITNGSGILTFSEDGTLLACGTSWGDVGLWNFRKNTYIFTAGHRSPGGGDSIKSFAFSKDHTTFASTSADKTIRLWDTITGGYKGTLVGHTNNPYFVVFANDDNTLVSKGFDGTILLWDITPSVDTDAIVSVTPTLVDSLASGEHLTFNINIDGGKNITGYQIFLEYDSNVLRYLSMKNGDLLNGKISSNTKVAYRSHSLVRQNLSLLQIFCQHRKSAGRFQRYMPIKKSAISGSGTLAKITFEVLSEKPTTLRLPKVNLVTEDRTYVHPIIVNGSIVGNTQIDTAPINDPRFHPTIDTVHTMYSLPEGAVGRIGKGTINDIKYSPDKSLLAVAGSIGIWLYDANTGMELALLTGHTAPVTSIAFSPHGALLASGSYDKTIRLWNPHTHEQLMNLDSGDIIPAIAFSPDGKILANGSGKEIQLWDTYTGHQKVTISGFDGSTVFAVEFSPDGQMLASASISDNIYLWDPYTGKCKFHLSNSGSGSSTSITFYPSGPKLAFSPDSKILAGTTVENSRDKNKIKLWDTHTGILKSILEQNPRGLTDPISVVQFSWDGTTLVSGSERGILRVWDLKTGQNMKTLDKIENGEGFLLPFSPDRTTFVSAENDGVIRLWDTRTEKTRMLITGHTGAVSSMAFSPDSKLLACGSQTGKTYLWEMKTRQSNLIHKDDQNVAHYVSFAPDGLTLASTGRGGTSLYDVHTLQHKAILPEIGGHVFTFSPDGQTIASARGHSIRITNSQSGDHEMTLWGHLEDVVSLVYSPNGAILASQSKSSWYKEKRTTSIRLWDTKNGKEHMVFTENAPYISPIAFSPDGQTLASTYGATIKFWDISTGEHTSTLNVYSKDDNPEKVWTGKFVYSPDGTKIASLVRKDNDNTIIVRNIDTGKQRIFLPKHIGPITSFVFSPDSTTLASGSQDGTVLLWKIRELPVTRLNITPLAEVASPIGKHLTFNVNMRDAQNVIGYQFGLRYDSQALRFIPNTENNSVRNIKTSPPVVGENIITFSGNATQGSNIAGGTIATVTFEVIKYADVTLTITDAHLTHDNGLHSRPVVGRAWVVEPERIPEDVNRDWHLDATDLEFVSSNIGQTGIGNSADVNKDGQIDIADLVLVRNALYGVPIESEKD